MAGSANKNIFPNNLLAAKIWKTAAPESLNIYRPCCKT